MSTVNPFRLAAYAALLLCMGLAVWAYAPALHGPFLFDDYANLPTLGAYGRVDDAEAFARYITSGFADPLGRPLSLLTFLIDAQDWPADPYPFKRTNLLLHLLNFLLLAQLLIVLGRRALADAARAEFVGVLAAGLWALHPLFVSTTAYVVQREAMLPVTFVLLALLGYCRGRRLLARDRVVSGSILVAFSIGGGTLAATACKANGLLLPTLVLVVEWFLLRTVEPIAKPRARRWHGALLVLGCVLPTLVVLAYLAYVGVPLLLDGHDVPNRPWTLAQRLLSEPRAVAQYIALLLLPRTYTSGVFNDDFTPSTGWFDPWLTLPCLVFVAALLAGAIALRRRQPILATAVVFYFAGHLLESTTIPLELYFEHRNYLPAIFFAWPIALLLTAPGLQYQLRLAVARLLPIALALQTHAAAQVWGDARAQAEIWVTKNPRSARAQTYAALAEKNSGDLDRAEARLRKAVASAPHEAQYNINLLGIGCERGHVERADLERTAQGLREARLPGALTFNWIEDAIGLVQAGRCGDLTLDDLERLVDAAAANPAARQRGRAQDFTHLRGLIALARGDGDGAAAQFDRALEITPEASLALSQAATLGAAGFPRQGLKHLDRYDALPHHETPPIRVMADVHRRVLARQGYWANEFRHLRETLQGDVAAEATP